MESYPISRHALTHVQQRQTEQRLYSDTSLIMGGAHVNALGRLVITEQQLADIAANQYIVDRNAMLNTPFPAAFDALPWSNALLRTRVTNALHTSGVSSVRDLYVIGRNGFRDIRNLAGLTEAAVSKQLTCFSNGMSWLEQPTILDIASICDNTGQITSLVLQPNFRRFRHGEIAPSVKQIVDMSTEELKSYHTYPINTQSLHRKATDFTDAFIAAKMSSLQAPWYKSLCLAQGLSLSNLGHLSLM